MPITPRTGPGGLASVNVFTEQSTSRTVRVPLATTRRRLGSKLALEHRRRAGKASCLVPLRAARPKLRSGMPKRVHRRVHQYPSLTEDPTKSGDWLDSLASASILEEVQPESDAVYLDQGSGTLPAHHRSNQGVPSSPSKEAEATENLSTYYK